MSDRLTNLLAVAATGLADEQRRAMAAATGLTESGVAAVVALDQFLDGSRIGDIASVLGLSHSGAVRVSARLVDAGLLQRVELGDRREVGVRLTARGRSVARRAAAVRADVAQRLVDGMSDRQRRDFERMLGGVVAQLTRERLEHRRATASESPWLCRTCDLAACGRPDGRCPAANEAAAGTGET